MNLGRLLVFDDDQAIGDLVIRIARSAGFEARHVSRPDAFFQALDVWQPTHVSLDLVMPGMDGPDVLGQLARLRSRVRLIVISGSGGRALDAAARSAAEAGLDVVGILAKPFTPAELRALLGLAPAAAALRADMVMPASVAPLPELTAAALRDALDDGELRIAFQPIVACRSGQLSGFEALARWRRPHDRILEAGRFVALAEENGLIEQLTDAVLRQMYLCLARMCGGTGALDNPDQALLSLSFNVPLALLADAAFVTRTAECFASRGVAASQLTFETRPATGELAQYSLQALRESGFRLAIEGFGARTMSWRDLACPQLTDIKIDASLVCEAAHSPASRSIINGIVAMGHAMGKRITAVGVEDAGTFAFLAAAGCDLAQGYFIAPPMPVETLSAWSADRSRSLLAGAVAGEHA